MSGSTTRTRNHRSSSSDDTFRLPKAILSNFPILKTIRCKPKKIQRASWSLTDRQERLKWWDQTIIRGSRVLVIGCGGLGSILGLILQQMGVGGLDFMDGDLVEDSNRNRQLFTANDVGHPKAHRVLHNLQTFAVHNTILRGYYQTFEEWRADRRRPKYDVVCCGVDSIPTMVAASRYGLETRTPVIFVNISADGEALRVFTQRTSEPSACFVCYRPSSWDYQIPRDQECIPVPAIADILHVAVGFAARAVVGELLGEPMGTFNCRDITFGGIDLKRTIPRAEGCKLCGTIELSSAEETNFESGALKW